MHVNVSIHRNQLLKTKTNIARDKRKKSDPGKRVQKKFKSLPTSIRRYNPSRLPSDPSSYRHNIISGYTISGNPHHSATPPPVPPVLLDPFLNADDAEHHFQQWASTQQQSPNITASVENQSEDLPTPDYSSPKYARPEPSPSATAPSVTQREHGDYFDGDWEDWEWEQDDEDWNDESWWYDVNSYKPPQQEERAEQSCREHPSERPQQAERAEQSNRDISYEGKKETTMKLWSRGRMFLKKLDIDERIFFGKFEGGT